MDKRFTIFMAVLIAGFVGIVWWNSAAKNNTGNGNSNGQVQASQHIVGNPESKVTLVEYGDFQCPACYSYEPAVQEVIEKYGDRIAFQFRHFPLIQIHTNAMAAHKAAEAAGMQGKFWEMHDLLYERQPTWSQSANVTPIFESYAEELELDMEQYKTDVRSSEVNAVINADLSEGKAAGATGTPTFVLNGKKLEGLTAEFASFAEVLDEALKETE